MPKYRILAALWLFQLVNYAARTSISFAGPEITKSLHMDPKAFGIILSSFALGYFLAQIPGGMAADRFGSRVVLIIGPLFWALFTGWVGLASTLSSFVILRLCFGVAEGASNAAVFKVIGDVFSPRERVQASAIWATSLAVAPAIAGPVIGLLLTATGWRALFVVLAAPAVLIAVLNAFVIPRPKRAEQEALESSAPRDAGRSTLRTAMVQPALWIVCIAYLGFNIAFFGYLGWMPSYLAAARSIDLRQVGLLGGIPFIFGAVGLVLTGWLASGVLYTFRCHLLALSHLLAAIFLVLAFQARTLDVSLIGLSGAAFFLYGGFAIYGPIVLELAPDNARGFYSSLVASSGQFAGIVAPASIGFLVASAHNYGSAFSFMIAALIAAALGALVLNHFLRRTDANTRIAASI